MKKIITFLLLAFSVPAFAHVRWFVEQEPPAVAWPIDSLLFLLIAGALVYMAVIGGPLHRFDRFRPAPGWAELLVRFSLALTLLLSSSMGVWIAPNLEQSPLLLNWQQAVAILLLANRRVGITAFFITCALSLFTAALDVMVDYVFELLGVALALAVWKNYSSLALFFLRMGMGLQLVALAIHNKLMNPALGMQFLVQHPYNFMQPLFESFSDLHFVMAAGFAELAFGLMFVFNRGVRLNGAIISFFFLLTSLLMGLHELVGHLPILLVLLVLTVWGGGPTARELGPLLGRLGSDLSRMLNTLKKSFA